MGKKNCGCKGQCNCVIRYDDGTYPEVDGNVTILPAPTEAKECNFVYVEHDPAIHDGGDIEGDGSAGDPWQIPLPCCDDDHVNVGPGAPAGPPGDGTHTYIEQVDPADPSTWIVHYWTDSAGDETGDGWVTIPQECCVYQFDADYVPADGDNPSGSGTAADPFLLPIPQFVYVQYDEAVHGDLTTPNIEGDGSTADPFQIPICCDTLEIVSITTAVDPTSGDIIVTVVEEADGDEGDGVGGTDTHVFNIPIPPAAELNYTYVTYDPAVHDGGPIEGDGSAANPWQIPLPCCPEFVYVPYDEATHGPIDNLNDPVGAGTAADPLQIPICCSEPIEWVYVEFDPAVHVDGEPPEGDGSAADPFQIPLPCCESDCFVHASEDHLGQTIDLSGKPGGGDKVPPTTAEIVPPGLPGNGGGPGSAQGGGVYNNGVTPGSSVGTTPPPGGPPPYSITVPSVAAYDMVIVNVTWGRIEDGTHSYGPSASIDGNTVGTSPFQSLCNTDGFEVDAWGVHTTASHQFCADVTGGGGGQIDVGFPGMIGNGRGLVAIELIGYTGITCADLLAPIDVHQQGLDLTVYGTNVPSDPFALPAGSTCGIWFGGGRHVMNDGNWSIMTASDPGVNIVENMDWELSLPGQDNVCQIGITNGLVTDVPAGSTLQLTSISNATPATDWENHGNYCFVPIADPVAPGGSVTETIDYPPLTFDNPCEEDYDATCTGTFDISITEGGDDTVTAIVTFNGVAQAPITASGVYTYTETTTLPASSTAHTCTMSVEIVCDDGADDTADPTTSVVINGATLEVA